MNPSDEQHEVLAHATEPSVGKIEIWAFHLSELGAYIAISLMNSGVIKLDLWTFDFPTRYGS